MTRLRREPEPVAAAPAEVVDADADADPDAADPDLRLSAPAAAGHLLETDFLRLRRDRAARLGQHLPLPVDAGHEHVILPRRQTRILLVQLRLQEADDLPVLELLLTDPAQVGENRPDFLAALVRFGGVAAVELRGSRHLRDFAAGGFVFAWHGRFLPLRCAVCDA
jgi:hypothetical protein